MAECDNQDNGSASAYVPPPVIKWDRGKLGTPPWQEVSIIDLEEDIRFGALLNFYDFFNTGTVDGGFEGTKFAKRAKEQGISDPVSLFRCLLDVVLIWLTEGDATLVCPSYEEYLLAVITIIERQRHPNWSTSDWCGLRRATDEDPEGFDVFFWGEPPAKDDPSYETWFLRTEQRYDYDDFDGRVPVGRSAYSHPALRREVYEHARARRLRFLSSDVDDLERHLGRERPTRY